MNTTTIERPRYRVVGDRGCFANGTIHQKGAEVQFDGWPRQSELEPLNTGAERIARYYRTRHTAPGLPQTPWSAKYQRYWLPALPLAFHGQEPMGIVLDKDVDPGLTALPEYEVTRPWWHGRYEIDAGEVVKFVGWVSPDDDYHHPLRPINEPARRVVAYVAENFSHPGLEPRGPFCFYSGLFLPELAKLERAKSHPTRAYPGGYTPLDTDRYADAIAGEIAAATGRPPGAPGAQPVSTRSGFSTHVGRARPLANRE
jgi:hypothetical protein